MKEQSKFDRELYSNVKMQFYPTDNAEMRKLSKLFNFDDVEEACVLEPCIGDASAVLSFTNKVGNQNKHIKIFGVELNANMFEGLKDNSHIDYAIHSDFLHIRCNPKSAFSMVFCNPPYGGDMIDSKLRLEDTFLKDATSYLKIGGFLVWIVPVGLFEGSKNHLKLFSNRYEVLELFKFTEPEFSKFKQVVLIGKKKAINSVDHEQEQRLQNLLSQLEALPLIPVDGDGRYNLIKSSVDDVKIFAPSNFDYAQGLEYIKNSSLRTKLIRDSKVESFGIEGARPPIMPNSSQFFTILSVGRANVAKIHGKNGALVQRGTLKHVVSDESSSDDKVITETSYSKASVCIIEASGNICRLS